MLRHDGRSSHQMRPIRFVPNFTKHAAGSVLVEYGDTKVICTVCVDESIPSFLRNKQPAQGWLTANTQCYLVLLAPFKTRKTRTFRA